MNVEVCVSRVGSIKYLFKYVCKGSDRVTVQFQEDGRDVNEIDQFIDARCISASEAAWRIMAFEIVTNEPSVVHLEVHLDGKQNVYFREVQEAQAAVRGQRGTKLTAWFDLNSDSRMHETCVGLDQLKYPDIPNYFT